MFVSNRKQVVPLWRQRAGRDEEKVIKNIEYMIAIKRIKLFVLLTNISFLFFKNICLKLVIWDYHVILVYKSDDRRCLVFDLDSDLPFPTFFHKVSNRIAKQLS